MSQTRRGRGAEPEPATLDLGLVDALTQLSFAVQGLLGHTAAECDLSMVQVRLLGILRDHTPTINDIARFLQLDKSSVTGLIDRAQERHLVVRVASQSDRRSVRVMITPEGRQIVERATAAFEDRMSGLVSELTPTQRVRLSRTASLVVAAEARRRGIALGSDP